MEGKEEGNRQITHANVIGKIYYPKHINLKWINATCIYLQTPNTPNRYHQHYSSEHY